jgi:release factor glutamine methyltransferase
MALPEAVIARLRAAGCVFAEEEAALLMAAAATPEALELLVQQREHGTPLEHILGWAEFAGLRIEVDPGVFVPRQRTRFLVQEALRRAAPDAVVLDLCCGSGAVGAAILAAKPGIELHAADIDPAAVRSARRNIHSPAHVYEGDLFEPLPESLKGRISILVANAPYVPTVEIAMMPPEARLHEATIALDGGSDGLDIQRRVAAAARDWLAPGGFLLVETSELQSQASAVILEANGLIASIESSDELDATLVVGQWL